MPNRTSPSSDSPRESAAYLVVRDGNKWRDVFPLTPGQVTTVGRAPTNRIIVRDELCSRNHCQIFDRGAQWVLNDLESRNGTLVNGKSVEGEWHLEAGQVIQIGDCDIGFTNDLADGFPELDNKEEPKYEIEAETMVDVDLGRSKFESGLGPEILHRKRRNRYLPTGPVESLGRDRTSQELAKLYRLALEMGATRDAKHLAEVVLAGLFSGTAADIGDINLLPAKLKSNPDPQDLELIAYQSLHDLPYQKASDQLTEMVLGGREAILARDVADDSRLANRDSLGRIHAKSVIAAPIRTGDSVRGLIHLYSSDLDHPLDADDLEFTLAVADQMAVALENLTEKASLADGLARARNENKSLRQQLQIESELVGQSESMAQLRQSIARIAPSDATALIRGESGVGKELVARAIHYNSRRKNAPFVCLNCAALSESLLESELFGHEKGSFTGATDRKIGKFEQADGGTLFLDEVGEMSPAIQAKFLRVLEGHPFERVGGGTSINVDVRVVAATNRNLEQAVEEKTFRNDLYFRLFVAVITVDALRKRRSDISVLAQYFLEKFAIKMSRTLTGFSDEAMDALRNYDWPGNVRELQNTIERAVILCPDEIVGVSDIQLSALGTNASPTSFPAANEELREVSLEELEQEHILGILEQTNWNKSRAAQILGIERSTLDRKLKRYDVTRPKQT